jgi:hypothetical protein
MEVADVVHHGRSFGDLYQRDFPFSSPQILPVPDPDPRPSPVDVIYNHKYSFNIVKGVAGLPRLKSQQRHGRCRKLPTFVQQQHPGATRERRSTTAGWSSAPTARTSTKTKILHGILTSSKE